MAFNLNLLCTPAGTKRFPGKNEKKKEEQEKQ
jgi:hypothetical protein